MFNMLNELFKLEISSYGTCCIRYYVVCIDRLCVRN